jgi:hypothetical protein
MAQNNTLLDGAAATGPATTWAGGRGQFKALGSFGGATVTLQILGPDGATWLALGAEAALTGPGVVNFDCPPGQLRAAVSGGSPSGLHAAVASL